VRRAASRRHPAGAKGAAPKGFRSGQHGSERERSGQAGRRPWQSAPGSAQAGTRGLRAQRDRHINRGPNGPAACRRAGQRSAGPGAAATGALRGVPRSKGVCRRPWAEARGKAFPQQSADQNEKKAPDRRGFELVPSFDRRRLDSEHKLTGTSVDFCTQHIDASNRLG
jgi:hypothetical protein